MSYKGLYVEVDSALHMITNAFTEGEARVLAENAELTNPDSLTMHKSGLELWRLLKCQFMPAANAMHEVLPELAGLAVASKDPEFERMRRTG